MMIEKCSVIFIYAFIYFIVEVDTQICDRTEAATRMVRETYVGNIITTYQGTCLSGYRCIKTRYWTTLMTRNVPQRELKTVKYCCTGYIRTDESSDDSNIVCEPICMPACKNGYCRVPGECACNPGYEPDPADNHNCLPTCDPPCEHGTCIEPNKCQCNFGYSHVNFTCKPICTDPCSNGTCTAPENCECLDGYRKSERNACEPYCSTGCDNGSCVGPETCICNPGWHFNKSRDIPYKRCVPFCSNPCDNGNCVAPNTCECWPFYTNSDTGLCESVCQPGWKLVNGTCVPQCTSPCGNGTCVAPNTCICFSGYQQNVHVIEHPGSHPNSSICIPICFTCSSQYCVAPNECEIATLESDYYYDYDVYSDTNISEIINNNKDDTTSETSEKSNKYTYSDETMNITNSDKETTESAKEPIHTSNRFNDTDTEAMKRSWIQQNWASIFIPLLVVVTAGAVMLLVWRWTPIIIYFKGRSYVVEDNPVNNKGSQPFEDIQISATDEKEINGDQSMI